MKDSPNSIALFFTSPYNGPHCTSFASAGLAMDVSTFAKRREDLQSTSAPCLKSTSTLDPLRVRSQPTLKTRLGLRPRQLTSTLLLPPTRQAPWINRTHQLQWPPPISINRCTPFLFVCFSQVIIIICSQIGHLYCLTYFQVLKSIKTKILIHYTQHLIITQYIHNILPTTRGNSLSLTFFIFVCSFIRCTVKTYQYVSS
jgi:hypothetical protein